VADAEATLTEQTTAVDRWVPNACALIFVVAIVVASLSGDSKVDTVALTQEQARSVVDAANLHPDATRLAFLCVVVALLCIGPVVRPLVRLAPGRGSVLAELGYRMMCIGSVFEALGNAYAPLVLGSTAGLDREVMAHFVRNNETSWVSFFLLAVNALLPVGAILLGAGLLRAGGLPRWQPLLFILVFAAILPTPIGYGTLALAALFAVVFITLVRPAAAGRG